jgi:hypothetical protein
MKRSHCQLLSFAPWFVGFAVLVEVFGIPFVNTGRAHCGWILVVLLWFFWFFWIGFGYTLDTRWFALGWLIGGGLGLMNGDFFTGGIGGQMPPNN